MADSEIKSTEKEEEETAKSKSNGDRCGTILQCGATDYWAPGRTKGTPREDFPSLHVPHRLQALEVSPQPVRCRDATLPSGKSSTAPSPAALAK